MALFITQYLQNDINNNVINIMFPHLISPHKQLLLKYLIAILNILAYIYNFNNNDYIHQIQQNNYQDVKWLLLFLLPYLNKGSENITNLNDIYISKIKNVDINTTSPQYLYSNLQYGRCKRNNIAEEIHFNEEHIKHNFYLLLDSFKISSHKLYVNWIDVLPYTLHDLEITTLYKNTLHSFLHNNLSDWNPIDITNIYDNNITFNILHSLSNLYIGDLYNTVRIYLYEDIKPIKWLIYDVVSYDENIIFPGIILLEHLFNDNNITLFSKALQNKKWIELSNDDQLHFNLKWTYFINHVLNNQSYSSNHHIITQLSLERFLKSIVMVFDNRYAKNNSDVINSNYIPLNSINDIDDDVEISLFHIKKNLLSIKEEYIYDFIRKDLQIFKYTWYGTTLLTSNKQQMKYDYLSLSDMMINSQIVSNNTKFTHKIFYNFCKSLVNYIDPIDNKYKSFPENWKMLELNQQSEFLNRINNKYTNVIDWFNIGRNLKYIKNNLGISNSITNLNINIYNQIRNHFIKIIFDTLITKGILSIFIPNKYISDKLLLSNNKITSLLQNTVFSNDSIYRTDSYYYLTEMPYNLLQYTDSDFFLYNSTNSWYNAYTLNWISQLGFCHHFIHNRVLYITGATGVGKSTQIPKLFIYYLKAIDYNSSGRVVCSQPRISPTLKNAKVVSFELGVPIHDVSLNNYYVQMNFKENDYIDDTTFLKPHINKVNHLSLKYVTDGLLLQEINNLLVKTIYNNKYNMQNIYDIIIIDEAHEHNKNIDLLLTILRDSVYYNNSLRLVIMSATIDDDESIYRRYYRNINDNKKYPLDCWLRNNSLDRINIDRRFHISPPNITTKFIISEFYSPNSDPPSIIHNIIRNGLNGDILLFQHGIKEIKSLVNILNNDPNIPSNIIALPYHSKLDDIKRKYIEEIDDNIKSLKINKTDDFNDINIDTLINGSGNYTNFILVATNIAEASITIKTLKYIIDNGSQKINMYDYIKKGSVLKISNISETSRIQRKGRVGRVSDGSIYYLYNKNDMLNNIKQYNICLEDISSDLFKMLCTNSSNQKLLSYDPTILKKNQLITNLSSDLLDIFNSLYTTNNGYFSYLGNPLHYDYDHNDHIIDKLSSGYSLNTLNDNNGIFYLIHPDELYLNRDIMGRIINSSGDDVIFKRNISTNFGNIISKKIHSFWNDFILIDYLTNDMNKSDFGLFMTDVLNYLQFDNISLGKLFIFGSLLDIDEPIIKIISMIKSTDNGNISKLLYHVPTKQLIINFNNLKSTFKLTIDSDFDVLLLLADDLLSFISHNSTYIYNSSDILSTNLSNNQNTLIKSINKNIFTNNSYLIDKWSNSHNLNINTMTKFYKEYLSLKDKMLQFHNLTPSNTNYLKTDYSKYIISLKNKYNNILDLNINRVKLSFCLASPFNIAKLINSTDKYFNIFSPTLDNIFSLHSLSPYNYIPKTFISPIYTSNYIFYLNKDIEYDTVVCIGYLPITYLKYLQPIYSPSRIVQIEHITDFIKIKKYINSHLNNILPSHYTILSNIKNTYNDLLHDLSYVSHL